MRRTGALPALALTLLCAAVLAACGGGSNDSATISESIHDAQPQTAVVDEGALPAADDTPALETGPTRAAASPFSGRMTGVSTFRAAGEPGQLGAAVPGALNMTDIRLGQTHVLPNGKRVWTQPELPNGTRTLRMTNSRDALALVKLSAKDAVDPVLEVWDNGYKSATLPLQPPSALPATEDGGQRYAEDTYSAKIPGHLIWDGVELKVSAKNYARGNALPLDVAAEYFEELKILPIYLFGATDTNSGYPLSTYGQPPEDAVRELNDRMPFDFQVSNHEARKIIWESLIEPPSGSLPAKVMRNYDDSDAILSITLSLMDGLRRANGQNQSPVTYYSPVLGLAADGKVRAAGGGLGWGGSATGNWSYSGVFIHELGHTFAMGHAGSSFTAGDYPYENGSLLGSTWGWDASRNLLMPHWIPPSASNAVRCSGSIRDDQGRCVKQDIMQSGSGDQAKGMRYAQFSDFSAAVMQERMEFYSVIPVGDEGDFVRFNSTTRSWESFHATTSNYANDGIAQNLALKVNVPVYTLFFTLSATTPEVNHFYAPIKYTGNLLGSIDPTSSVDLAAIEYNGKGVYRNFCRRTGCDYTLRMTYADGSQRYQLVQGGFRTSNTPSGAVNPVALDPLRSESFRRWVINVPGDKALRKVELLSTPEAWKGLPAQPQVLMSRDL